MTSETTIGRYRVLRRLGAGGMAEVFLASATGEEGFEKRVAIKRIHAELSLEASHVQSFADEARLVAQLSHANIVQVFSFEHDGESHFLVMEYVDGMPLSKAMRLGPGDDHTVPPDAALAIGVQVCEALAYAHAACSYDGTPMRIVHRDIKPANLMLTLQGQVKIADFGVARAATNVHHTVTGSGKGTLAYMAPEQLDGSEVTASSDLYALGVVLFELFTGKLLYDAPGLAPFMHRRQQGLRDEDIELLAAQDEELVPVIRRAIAEEPADRYADAREMGAALRATSRYSGPEALQAWIHRLTATEATVGGPSGGFAVTGPPDDEPSSGPGATMASEIPSTVVSDGPPAYLAELSTGDPPTASAPSRRSAIPWVVAAVLVVALLGVIGSGVLRGPGDTDPGELPGEVAPPVEPSDPVVEAETATEAPELPEPPTPTPVEVATDTSDRPEPATPPPVEEITPAEPEAATPAPPAVEGEGLLSVTTDPWAVIYVDGAQQGDPGSLSNLAVALGQHTITVDPTDADTPQGTFTVTFEQDGEQQKWRYEFRDGSWHARHR